MTDNHELEQRLRDALHAVAATTPDERPASARRPVAVATVVAIALAAAGVGAIALLGRTDDRHAVGSTPSETAGDASIPSAEPSSAPATARNPDGPTVLMPPDDVSPDIASVISQPTNPEHWNAALLAPTGDVFGVYVQPRICPVAMGPTCGEVLDGSSRMVGPNTVVGVPSAGDEAATGSTLYLIHGPCASVTISAPPNLDAWDDVALEALASIAMTGGGVAITVPTSRGWSSPGTARGDAFYVIQFAATVDGVRSDYTLFQEPGGNEGSLLFGQVATRSPTDESAFEIATPAEMDTRHAVVMSDAGTVLRLDGPGTPEQLTALARSLVPVAWDDVVAATPPTTTVPPIPVGSQPSGTASEASGTCQPRLTIDADD